MYKLTITAEGTAATASATYQTAEEAERAKAELLRLLKTPVEIKITPAGGDQ